jgi:NIPSNAP protein
MKRRQFIKTSMAATTVAGVGASMLNSATAQAAEEAGHGSREYYELRVYRLKGDASPALLHEYLEKALIPALNRLAVKPVGVFTEPESKTGPAVFVLIPYATLQMFGPAAAQVSSDPEYLKEGAGYLAAPKANPVFERIDSWLMLAFAGMPRLELSSLSRDKKARIFELRTYESHSESKALKKVEMFNSGEMEVMREVGLAPVFYGQALIGANLPHLTYMLSGENREEHKKHFDAFIKHPVWNKMKDDPQYADTVSNIKSRILEPTAYSQI